MHAKHSSKMLPVARHHVRGPPGPWHRPCSTQVRPDKLIRQSPGRPQATTRWASPVGQSRTWWRGPNDMKTATRRCAGTPVSRSQGGFSAAELLVVVGVIGVLFTVSVPFFLSAYQAAAARADVQQVMSLFNQARELAIKQNNSVCVSMPNNQQMQLMQGSCAGAAWVG